MSQDIFEDLDPSISGTELATELNNFKDAYASGLSGTSRPTELQAGGAWIDTTNDPTSWAYKIYTGSTDITVFTVDLSAGTVSLAGAISPFEILKVSDDANGSILNLIKRRIADSGKVLNGDVVAEINLKARDSASAADVTLATIVATATEDITASNRGVSLSFKSIPTGESALVEHMKFVSGQVQLSKTAVISGLIFGSQEVATSATIAALNGDKAVVEFTGSTATELQGIDATDSSKVIVLHNKSTANITVKNENSSASAANRFTLPSASDMTISPGNSAQFFYSTNDSRWLLLSGEISSASSTSETSFETFNVRDSWTAPSGVTKVKLVTTKNKSIYPFSGGAALDAFGNIYCWGSNLVGHIGDGTTTNRSSPVLVTGSYKFSKVKKVAASTFGITENGNLYGWGENSAGQLGIGSTTDVSSPNLSIPSGQPKIVDFDIIELIGAGLASDGSVYIWGDTSVLNGSTDYSVPTLLSGSGTYGKALKVVVAGESASTAALTILNEDGEVYAIGINSSFNEGFLGVGDVLNKTTPTIQAGSNTYKNIFSCGLLSTDMCSFGIDDNDDLYAWGLNATGQLGVGDTTNRSSPTIVLGSLKWKRIFPTLSQSGTFVLGETLDGDLYGWGDNTSGKLGLGDTTDRSSPVLIQSSANIKEVIAAEDSVIVLKKDGTMQSWGSNARGQLGDGTSVAKSTPTTVLGSLDVERIYSDFDFASMFAITRDGQIYSWGQDITGQLANGTAHVDISSPVLILGSIFADPSPKQNVFYLDVTPSTTYDIRLGARVCLFGSNPIGNDLEKLEIIYEE